METLGLVPGWAKAVCWLIFGFSLVAAIVAIAACIMAGKADDDAEKIMDNLPACDKDADR